MPINPTYPGVYIDEVPSAVRTIVGVPTSIAAFVGPAQRGPVDGPTHITSFADFERTYGGLWPKSLMSYAVYHFYLNGGSEAEIVRIAANDAAPATIDLGAGVTLQARSAGDWGNSLQAAVTRPGVLANPNLYFLTIYDSVSKQRESYWVEAALTSPRRLDLVLQASAFVMAAPGTVLDKLPTVLADVPSNVDRFAPPPPPPPKPPAAPAAPLFSAAAAGSGKDGAIVAEADYAPPGSEAAKTALYALLKTDIFNILCLPPPDRGKPWGDLSAAAKLCVDRRALLVVDAPEGWNTVATAVTGPMPILGDVAANAALYFPWLTMRDPLQPAVSASFPPCGAVAGTFARTDSQRGVWKAPAGTAASLNGVQNFSVPLTDLENGELNPLAVNCLRNFHIIGPVVWGARTMQGADVEASQWKYVPVRRLALYLEETLYRNLKWVVFEPNDEPLWSSIRLNVGAFMNSLWHQGAFQGQTPKDAYLVTCDKSNNPQNDIDRGIVNILVGFAPLKPAEFVFVHIQQLAGQVQV